MPSEGTLLIYLAKKGSLFREIEVSTVNVAKEIGSSQQTVSRKLIDLEKDSLIRRIPSTRGVRIMLSEKGRNQLEHVYAELKSIFEMQRRFLIGEVISGFGEGAYYISLKQYLEQFRKKLNINPYVGTLNLKTDFSEFLEFIANQEKIVIDSFKANNRTFGSLDAYKIKIHEIKGAIIIPQRTSHEKGIIEIISEEYLRGKLSLKDKDKVEIIAENGL